MLVRTDSFQKPFYYTLNSDSFKVCCKAVGATDSSLRDACNMHFLNPKWRHFEEVGISLQGKGLLPSFSVLLSSRPLSWWC